MKHATNYAKLSKRKMSRSTKLGLHQLETRSCPASFTYAPAMQTLTLTGGHNEQLLVETLPNCPVGYIHVTEVGANVVVFDSSTANQPVQNLVFKHSPTGAGYLTIANSVHLTGNLNVTGSPSSQVVYVDGTINGNFTYKEGATGAYDSVYFQDQAKIGGNVALNFGKGDSDTRIETGYFSGNVTINGGVGNNNLYVSKTGDIFIAGSLNVNFGNGSNAITALDAHLIYIGGSFAYSGGSSYDYLDFSSGAASRLEVMGNATFNLGKIGNANNDLSFGSVSVGGNLTIAAAGGEDSIYMYQDMTVGKNLSVALGDGKNFFTSNWDTSLSGFVGGSLSYAGGAQTDDVILDNLTVSKSATIKLGDSDTADQRLSVGTEGSLGVSVLGSVSITGGSKKDEFDLHRMYVGKSLTVNSGGGDDVVQVNDSVIASASQFNLGGGADQLLIETVTSDFAGDLSAPTQFGGVVTVNGGDGNDVVTLSTTSMRRRTSTSERS